MIISSKDKFRFIGKFGAGSLNDEKYVITSVGFSDKSSGGRKN
jgi:hypothetical protein